MIDKAAAGTSRPAPSRTVAGVGLAALFVLALVAAHAGAPYLFKRTTLQDEVATQVRSTTGLAIATEHARFSLLPRPHVAMASVHVTDPTTHVALDADGLDGDVRLLPLIVGRVELSTFNLLRPRLRVDLDGLSFKPDGTPDWAARAREAKASLQRRLGTVTFIDGTVTLTARARRNPIVVTNVNATVDWRDLDSPATLTGSLQVQHTPVDVAGWIAQPSHVMRGDRSTVALRIHSTPLDLTATGDLSNSTFKGHVLASAPSLDGLFELGTSELPLPAPFANVATSGDATATFDRDGPTTIDLQNLDFRADGNDYEGTLAYQGGARPLVTGTLATGHLVLAPFIAHVPRLVTPDHRWARTPLPPLRVGSVDLDIRISAAHLRLAPLGIDDAALSVMTRGNHLEIGLNEGKAYGGAIKGRISLGSGPDGLTIRAAGTVADADLATLSWDALGWQVASGAASGSANVETTGDSASALMAHLQGWAKGRAGDGEAFGIDLGAGLRQAAKGDATSGGLLANLMSGRTPYSKTTLNLRLKDGQASVDDATMQGSGATLSLAGTADLAGRSLDLHAAIESAGPPSRPNPGVASRLRLGVTGAFDRFLIAPEQAASRPVPSAPDP